MKCFRRACCLLLCVLFLLPLSALGEEDVLTQAGLALFGSEVYYPQLSKAPDDALLEDINRLIVTGLHADQYLDRMALVMSNTVKITTTYTADVTGDVLTCVLSASGPLKNNRATHAFTSVNIDLLTGQEIFCRKSFGVCFFVFCFEMRDLGAGGKYRPILVGNAAIGGDVTHNKFCGA